MAIVLIGFFLLSFIITPAEATLTWSITTIEDAGNVGLNTSIAIGKAGNPCISYYDETNMNLKYACPLEVLCLFYLSPIGEAALF